MRKIVCAILGVLLMSLVAIPIVAEADSAYQDAAEALEQEVSDEGPILSSGAVRNAYLLLRLKQYLQRAEQNYQSLQEKMDETRSEIDTARYDITTLEGQVAHLEDLVVETEDKIYNVQVQIAQKEIDIQDSMEQIAFHEIQIKDQKRVIASYMRLLYFEKNQNFDDANDVNPVKILLQKGTISSVLQSGTYLTIMEDQAEDLMDDLEDMERDAKRENYDLTVKYHQLANLNDQLDGELRNLSAQLEAKENLLADTLNSDAIYRELYASYKEAQEVILNEINMFQSNVSALDDRLSNTLSDAELEAVAQIQADAENGEFAVDAADFLQLDWPVSPHLGLTAFFDDAGYVTSFGVAHHALDLRIAHGSIIYAPADGIVYKVNDTAALDDEEARLGYGYIIVAHRKGVMTLYGHISGALVQEGDYVHRGQMIGLTGGVPGMPGSGVRTTGAHLHFEVIQDGIRVDPLEYVPLEEAPLDSLPEYYLRILEAELEAELAENGIESEDIELIDREEGEIVEVDIEEETQETIESTFDYEDREDDEFSEEDFWIQGELAPGVEQE